MAEVQAFPTMDISGVLPLFFRAAELRIRGQLAEAIACLDEALAISPAFIPCYLERGLMLAESGRHDEAFRDIDHFRKLAPASPDIEALRRQILAKAHQQLDDILREQPESLLARQQRADLHLATGRFAEAAQECQTILAAAPCQVEAWNTLGSALLAMDRPEKALLAYEDALSRNPSRAELWFNLGNTRQQLGRLSAAIEAYQSALDLAPGLAEAHMEIGHCHLLQGNFRSGWPGLEFRWQTGQMKPFHLPTDRPLWIGPETEAWPTFSASSTTRNLGDKTLLVWAEQGLGDSLQFIRFVPDLAEHAGQVILRIQEPLQALLEPMLENVRVIGNDAPIPHHDAHCPLLSLPLALGVFAIPESNRYLKAAPEKVMEWQARLGNKTRLQVGLTWAGRQISQPNRTRDIPLVCMAPLLQLAMDFISLQPEVPVPDRPLLAQLPALRCPEPGLEDFSETAALIENLDLVISADTAVAHLAGALGKPCWLLLRHASEWRWQRDRPDSPWYPSTRIFRQPTPGDWDGVIAKVMEAFSETSRIGG